ncbi:hypothetical protein BDV97DRAFT_412340 [Delphinella strobiligena]|nr:hypothetical protein BDV97DRAFT_412340 [Delphinella strobiligena]
MDNTDALQLVRRYTQKMHGDQYNDTVMQSLDAKMDSDILQERSGKMLFMETAETTSWALSDDEEAGDLKNLKTCIEAPELDAVVEELDNEWRKVISELSKKAGVQDRQAKLSPKYDQKDRLNVIYALIEESQSRMVARRETRVGKIKAWFHKVAESLNSHKYLFDLLPSGDKYTGDPISWDPHCCDQVTYQKHALLVADCLDGLSDQVRGLARALWHAPRSRWIKIKVATFYTTLFKLPTRILREWCRSSAGRFVHSFSTSFGDHMQDCMSKLTRYVEQVDVELSRYIQLKDHNTLIRLGEQFTAFLMNNSKSNCDARTQGLAKIDSATVQRNDTRYQTRDEENSLHWTAKDIQQAAAKLKYYIQESRTEALIKESEYLFINNEIAYPATFEPTQNTLTAACMISRIRSLRIPVISYFCVYEACDWQTFSRSHELLKMVYSLIYQVCSFLPEGMSAADEGCANISPSRVEAFGPSVQHLPEAIELLGELLCKAPSLLFCIVDGFQLLDKEEGG